MRSIFGGQTDYFEKTIDSTALFGVAFVSNQQSAISNQQSAISNSTSLIFKKFTFLGICLLGLSACSLDASLGPATNLTPSLEVLNRTSPDLTHGEVVTTTNGFQLKGIFGEISEKTTSINGNQWQIEGVFYE